MKNTKVLSVSLEKQVSDDILMLSKKLGLSRSTLINELLKHGTMKSIPFFKSLDDKRQSSRLRGASVEIVKSQLSRVLRAEKGEQTLDLFQPTGSTS